MLSATQLKSTELANDTLILMDEGDENGLTLDMKPDMKLDMKLGDDAFNINIDEADEGNEDDEACVVYDTILLFVQMLYLMLTTVLPVGLLHLARAYARRSTAGVYSYSYRGSQCEYSLPLFRSYHSLGRCDARGVESARTHSLKQITLHNNDIIMAQYMVGGGAGRDTIRSPITIKICMYRWCSLSMVDDFCMHR